MNVSKDCESATYEHFKSSDKKKISSDASIVIALIRKQPQGRLALAKSAGIHPSSFSRVKRLLVNREIMRETDEGYVLWYYRGQSSLWDRVQNDLKQVGCSLIDIGLQRASYSGRDSETGWRLFVHSRKCSISGIVVLRGMVESVVKVRSAGIVFSNEYDGVVLTRDSIGFKDRLWSNGDVYEIRAVEKILDDHDSMAYHIAKTVRIILSRRKRAIAVAPSKSFDVRSHIRAFLSTHLNSDNITRDDGERASHCVIYSDPPYPLIEEFDLSAKPVEGVYAIGIPETTPLIDVLSRRAYAYEERAPVSIHAVDQSGVSSSRLRGKMEAELRRVFEASPMADQCYGQLEKRRETSKSFGSAVLHSAEFVLVYQHSRIN